MHHAGPFDKVNESAGLNSAGVSLRSLSLPVQEGSIHGCQSQSAGLEVEAPTLPLRLIFATQCNI